MLILTLHPHSLGVTDSQEGQSHHALLSIVTDIQGTGMYDCCRESIQQWARYRARVSIFCGTAIYDELVVGASQMKGENSSVFDPLPCGIISRAAFIGITHCNVRREAVII